MIKAAIAGATGYVGVELLRLLQQHPEVEVVYAGTESYADQALGEVYPHLQAITSLKALQHDAEKMAQMADVIFTALPHGVAMQMAPMILTAGKKLIDLGADFRLQNPDVYQNWYQHEPAAKEILQQAVYGLPEISQREEIVSAQLIANPGCYPTAAILGIMPALQAGIVEHNDIIIDAKSGVSGAGRGLALGSHFCEVAENFKAYNIAGLHRHTPEIEQNIAQITKKNIPIQFTPHLVPMVRGLLATSYLKLNKSLTTKNIWDIYAEAYQAEPFIRLRPINELPQTKQVTGSNYCDIGLQIDLRTQRLIVVSVIDNLLKGAAGQAVQNFNLMFGFAETLGLLNWVPSYP